MQRAKDLSGLLLLHSAKGSAPGMGQLVADSQAQGKANVAFLGLFLMGRLDECVDLLVASGRVPEAAFLARTYVPSRVSEVGLAMAQSLHLLGVSVLLALGQGVGSCACSVLRHTGPIKDA